MIRNNVKRTEFKRSNILNERKSPYFEKQK